MKAYAERKRRFRTSVVPSARQFHRSMGSPIRGRKLIDSLVCRRAAMGVTQNAIAKALGCSQSWVSKLEMSNDGDLRVSDLVAYAKAVGMEALVTLRRN